MSEFKLPPGYAAWCHQCGEPPFNKFTAIEIPTEPSMEEAQLPKKCNTIPGIGFKTLNELSTHTRDVHRTWKG